MFRSLLASDLGGLMGKMPVRHAGDQGSIPARSGVNPFTLSELKRGNIKLFKTYHTSLISI